MLTENDLNPFVSTNSRLESLRAPTRIAGYYLLFGIAWILTSDVILLLTEVSDLRSCLISAVKGILFVVCSAMLVYFLLRHHVHKFEKASWLTNAVLENTTDGIYVKDRSGKYCLFNQAAASIVGTSTDQVLGKDDITLFAPEIAQQFRAGDLKVLEDGVFVTNEEVLIANGGAKTYLASKIPLKESTGKIIGLIGVSRDITDRKKMEQELLAERNRFEKIMEAVPIMICSYLLRSDGSAIVAYASPRIQSIFGLADGESAFDAELLFQGVASADGQRIKSSIKRSAKDRSIWRDTFLRYHSERGSVWIEGCLLPTMHADHETMFYGYFADVTEQKAIRLELEHAEDFAKKLMSSSVNGLYVFDLNVGAHVLVNEAFTEILGYMPEEIYRLTRRSLLRLVHPDDRTSLLNHLRNILQSHEERVFEIQYRFRAKNGHWVWCVSRDSIYQRDEHGAVHQIVGTFWDITDRRRLEEQLLQSQKMEAVGRLAGGLAHDFNNVLTVINGYSGVILKSLSPESPNYEPLSAVRDAGERAASLTRQLLAFSRKALVEPKIVDLNQVIQQTESLLRRVLRSDIVLAFNLKSSPFWIKADPIQLDQIILNLVINSRDALPQGGTITIDLDAYSLSERAQVTTGELRPGKYVRVSFQDNGSGIDEITISRIFEPFFTTKELGKGTGLGLAVVHGIVQQAGGAIQVESKLGHGTTIMIYWPLTDELPSRPKHAQLLAYKGGTESILLVEDDAAVRQYCQKTLQSAGYRVVTACDADEATSLIDQASSNYDILITDVVMPRVSGRELAELFRKKFPALPVLLISGYTEDKTLQQNMQSMTGHYLQKPFAPIELTSKVRLLLDLHAARQKPTPQN